MTKAIYRIIIGAFFCIAMVCIGATEKAAAQVGQNCCTFKVVVSNGVPLGCLPISLMTSWGTATQTDMLTTRGNAVPPLAIQNPCPPPPAFNWVSIDGGTTTFGLGNSGCIALPCGTNVNINTSIDANGCIEIHISPC